MIFFNIVIGIINEKEIQEINRFRFRIDYVSKNIV